MTNELPHAKPTKWHVRPAKTQISLGICPVYSESSLSAWRKLGSLATHWVHNEDSDQTGQMPRLIWVFAGRTLILLVLLWGGSDVECTMMLFMKINLYLCEIFVVYFCLHFLWLYQMSRPMWKRYLWHWQIAKAQMSLPIRAVWPQPSLFAHIIYGPHLEETC